jgi:hypothetical protein
MRSRRVGHAIGFAVSAAWPLFAALLAHTGVAAVWGGGGIGTDPSAYYWIFLTGYSASLILFAESVRRRSWPGVCLGVVYLSFWTLAGWAVAVLPAPA